MQGKTLGILGGGQLAKMLLQSAHKMGVKTHIYAQSPTEPASEQAMKFTQGDFTDLKKISSWVKSCDAVTFESEFLDLNKLKNKNIFPSTQSMNTFRDRLTQKQVLQKFKIPTSPFLPGNEVKKFNQAVVFKKRLFGYDGYGTQICKTKKEFELFFDTQPSLNEWICEDFIPFKKELAFALTRNASNDFCTLPLVETFQKNAKCHWVKGPLNTLSPKPSTDKTLSHKQRDPNLNSRIKKQSKQQLFSGTGISIKNIKKMLTSLDYVGLITFELFLTKENKILVNEVAPRVHNSGHYSIEALSHSQFDLHILALFNQPLPKTPQVYSPFSMVNLVGTSTKTPLLKAPVCGHLHWYGKIENRLGRKMGHVTVLDKSSSKALKLALKEEARQSL